MEASKKDLELTLAENELMLEIILNKGSNDKALIDLYKQDIADCKEKLKNLKK